MTDYTILGCALSNLTADAFPLAVVLKKTVDGKVKLESYFLHGWQNFEEFFPDETREVVLDLVEELRSYPPGEPTDRFFRHLNTLNVGYIRFLEAGSANKDFLDGQIASYFANGHHPVSWPESFRKL